MPRAANSTISRHQHKTPDPALDFSLSSLHLLKRAQLQHHCKKLGLGGGGKNTDLIRRLQEHLKQTANSGQKSPRTPPPDAQKKQDDSRQEEPPAKRGWCVVHGQELTTDQWFPLALRCGRVCLTSHGAYTQLHLAPSSAPTPPGLRDNLVCGQCMERNREKESRLQQKSVLQDGLTPSTRAKASVGTLRSRNKSGKFQPQEDPEYAKKVDELLNQMASGKVDSQKVLQPIRPAVLHSPVGKQEHSPVAIGH